MIKKLFVYILIVLGLISLVNAGTLKDINGILTYNNVNMCMADGSVYQEKITNLYNISIYTNEKERVRVVDNGAVLLYGANDIDSDEGTSLNIIGLSNTTDWSGAKNRANINWWSGTDGWDNQENKALSIMTHRGGDSSNDQPNQVTFYSMLKSPSIETGKAFQWLWGEDEGGWFEFIHINRLRFPENYTGYYNNKSGQVAGIDIDDEEFRIGLDRNGDGSGLKFAIVNGSGSEIPSRINQQVMFYLDQDVAEFNIDTLYIDDLNGAGGNPKIQFNGRAEVGFDGVTGSAYIKGIGKKLQLGVDSNYYITIDTAGKTILNSNSVIIGDANGVYNLGFAIDRGNVGYDGSVYLKGGVGKSLKLITNNNNIGLSINTTGGVTIPDLSGTYSGGSAYVCVNDAGTIYASENACP